MDQYLLEAPTELARGVEAINVLFASDKEGPRIFSLACKSALDNGGKTAGVLQNMYESTKPSTTLASEIRNSLSAAALNTIEYILTGAVMHKCKPKALVKAVSKHCELSSEAVRVLGTKYFEYLEELGAGGGTGPGAKVSGDSIRRASLPVPAGALPLLSTREAQVTDLYFNDSPTQNLYPCREEG